MEAIRTEKLRKEYEDATAVEGLTLAVEKGELFALLGVNGAGKTTTIKMLSGLAKPTAGDAWLMGKSISKESAAVKGLIGVSPQETAVAPKLSVRENLEFICGVNGFDRARKEEKIKEAAGQLGLGSIMERKAGKLSGGWQRRLSIALALISGPEILFLDEPTLGLDVIAWSGLWNVMRKLKGEMTIILTTHYLEEAVALSDRIGIMKGGRMMALGTADEIMEKAGCGRFEDAFIKIVTEANA